MFGTKRKRKHEENRGILNRLRHDNRGFTLIELGTVVMIIGTLTTMVVENVQRARVRTMAVSCIVNQRNIYQAALLYGADNLVPAGNVNVSLMVPGGYVPGDMADCPTSTIPDQQDYDIFFVAGDPATITCLIQGFKHQYNP